MLVIIGLLASNAIPAQVLSPQIIASSGATFSGSGVNLSYTIGEPLTRSLYQGPNNLTQGFHQTTFNVVAIEDEMPDFDVVVYPVPVDQALNVTSTREDLMKATLFDAAGKLLVTTDAFKKKIALDLRNLANGPYMLILTSPTGEPIKTFKVVKTSTY